MTTHHGWRCDKCQYFEDAEDEEGDGWCRRYAPRGQMWSRVPIGVHQSDPRENTTLWPLVDHGDWCGEFEPAKAPVTL